MPTLCKLPAALHTLVDLPLLMMLLLLQVVLQVRDAVQQLQPGITYNSCLLNLYQDGSHHVSWHSDDEKL